MKLKDVIRLSGLTRSQIKDLRVNKHLPAVRSGGHWDYDSSVVKTWSEEKNMIMGIMGSSKETVSKSFDYFKRLEKKRKNAIWVRESDGCKEKMNNQLLKIKDYCDREYEDVEIHEIWEEFGSAEKDKRPKYERLIKHIVERRIGYLFALKRNRFLRGDLYPLESICKRKGVKLIIIEDVGKSIEDKMLEDDQNFEQAYLYKKLLGGVGRDNAVIQKKYKKDYDVKRKMVIRKAKRGNKIAKMAMKLYDKKSYKSALEIVKEL